MPGVVLDAGGLIAFEKGDRGMVALLARLRLSVRLAVPGSGW